MTRMDVTVRGAGIFGLACAWEMQRRGAKVRVIERTGAFSGCSGGLVGALAPHVPERWNATKAFQFESLIMAEGFWADVARVSGRDPGYGRTGRLQPIADDEALARARERAGEAAILWQGKAAWHVVRAEEFGDWAPLSPSGWLSVRPLAWAIMPPCRPTLVVRWYLSWLKPPLTSP